MGAILRGGFKNLLQINVFRMVLIFPPFSGLCANPEETSYLYLTLPNLKLESK